MRALSLTTLLLVSIATRPAFAQRASRVCIDAATQGQTMRDEGRLRAAKDRFLACAASTCPPMVRQECARWATDVEGQIPTLVLGAKDTAGRDLAAVQVTLDGAPWIDALDGRPRPVDPGLHQLHFDYEGIVAEMSVLVRAGEKSRNVVAVLPTRTAVAPSEAMPPPRAPDLRVESRSTLPLWIFGGVALASAGAATAFAVHAHGQDDELRGRCAPACTDADTATMRTDLVLANVAVGVGVASLVGFAYFAFLAPRSGPSPSAVVPSPSGLRIAF